MSGVANFTSIIKIATSLKKTAFENRKNSTFFFIFRYNENC